MHPLGSPPGRSQPTPESSTSPPPKPSLPLPPMLQTQPPLASDEPRGIPNPRPEVMASNTSQVTNPVEWSTGLCACFSDVPNCCITLFCPCITFGQISEITDRGASSCPFNGFLYAVLLVVFGCSCMYSLFYRGRLRKQYNLKGSACGDCCVHSCCEVCALCQEYRELKIRGFDMRSGWHGNIENQNHGVMMTPPTQAGMRR